MDHCSEEYKTTTPLTVPEYRLYQTRRHEKRNTFLTVRRLERGHQELWLLLHEKPGGLIYFEPLDEETVSSLAHFVRKKQSGINLAEVKGSPVESFYDTRCT